MSAVLLHRMFIIIKTGIVPASTQKLDISSLLTRLPLEVGIFNDRLLADLIGSPWKILCDCEVRLWALDCVACFEGL
jgi:hypothetical protein